MWHLRPADQNQVEALATTLGLPRPLARVLALRGYGDPADARAFLASRDDLAPFRTPVDAPAMQKAVARIRKAVDGKERIGLYGDYDCDGVTSSAILYRYIARGLGADIQPRLPDRFVDGYGLHPTAVDQLADKGCKVILTCDNGISAFAAAKRARERGVDLVVTDHHQVGSTLPDAYALVHPQIEFPEFRDLCGAGVAFLFVIALEGGLTPRLEWFLDLVALGTVGDVVPVNGPNRALLWAGIQRMRRGLAHPGVKALAAAADLDLSRVSARDLGFTLCPRLNAPGRIDTPDAGFKLLSCNDRTETAALAKELQEANIERRTLSKTLETTVLKHLETTWDLEQAPFIALGRDDFHHGIMGLVASRIVERFRGPAMLFSQNDDGTWRGSGRSPDGFHLYEALNACSDYLLGFGGHANAAGCRVAADRLPGLQTALNDHLRATGWQRKQPEIWLDAELPFGEAGAGLLEALERLEPFGQKHPAPIFGLLRAKVLTATVKSEKHVFLDLDDGETITELKGWNMASKGLAVGDWVQIAYRAEWNTWKDQTRLQFVAEALEQVAPGAAPPSRQVVYAALEDRRKAGWLASAATELVGLYAHEEPAAEPWLKPGSAIPAGLDVIVCFDVPADLETWRSLILSAPKVVLAWKGLDGPELDPETLLAVYAHLEGKSGTDLFAAVEKAPVPLPEAQAAIRIFREAGVLVAAGGWRLLAPPESPIGLAGLDAYRKHRSARAFRERLVSATPDEALELAKPPVS